MTDNNTIMNFSDIVKLSELETIYFNSGCKPIEEDIGEKLSDREPLNRRSFSYLRQLNMRDNYVDDFAFQWEHLTGAFRKYSGIHLECFNRFGISPDNMKGKICLDAGSGEGRLAGICLGQADLVIGVELSEAIVQAANKFDTKKFIPIQASIDSMPIHNESVDFLFCWGVLHHSKYPHLSLKEMWRVLKPGGELYIWVYAITEFMLRRSLLSHHFSKFNVNEMYEIADLLTDTAHLTKTTSLGFSNLLMDDLSFSIKTSKEFTRLLMFDGLGPDYHYLLGKNWFEHQISKLSSVSSYDIQEVPWTVVRITKT